MTEAVGWALVQFLWQGALIAGVAALLQAIVPNRPSVRYAIACAGLAAMLLSAIVTAAMEVRVANANDVVPAIRESGTTAPVAQTITSGPSRSRPDMIDAATDDARFGWPWSRQDIQPWLPAAVTFWGLGVLMLSLRLFVDWLVVQRLRGRFVQEATDACQAALERAINTLAVSRPIQIMESALVDVPTAFGWIRPMILLPASSVTGLTPVQLEAVIAHEVAHIRRHDYLINIVQCCVEALLFYHPAVWWLSSRIRAEREQCCDDLAIQVCGDRLMYARALTALESLRQAQPSLVLAASDDSLLSRIERVLGSSRAARRSPTWVAAGVAAAVFALLVAPAKGQRAVEPQSDFGHLVRAIEQQLIPGDEVGRSSVENGRYRHHTIGVEFAIPPGWVGGQTGRSSDGGDGTHLSDPITGYRIQVWMITEGTTLENVRAESVDDIYRHTVGFKIRMRFDQGYKDYWVPPGTIEERIINGRKALVATGRFKQGTVEMAERLTWIYSNTARVFFYGRTPLTAFADFQFWFDEIANTATIP